MLNLFWYRCSAETFKMLAEGQNRILQMNSDKLLRPSTYQLYRWLSHRTDPGGVVTAKNSTITDDTGLSANTIAAARDKLVELQLIRVERHAGQGGAYEFTMRNPKATDFNQRLNWSAKPTPAYVPLPEFSMMPEIFAERWAGTSAALTYDVLCALMSKRGHCEVELLQKHWLKELNKATLQKAEEVLLNSGFIRKHHRTIEILNPETSDRMPEHGQKERAENRTFYVDPDNKSRRRFTEEKLSPEIVEQYFRKTLPRADEWVVGQNAHCPMHDDENPTLSIDVDLCKFRCWACGVGGRKLVSFQMWIDDSEDVQAAWKKVAKKLGHRVAPQSRGKKVADYRYRDQDGAPIYLVRRFADGSAQMRRFTTDGMTKPGLGTRKRTLYNLPEVQEADVVILVEGETKADPLTGLRVLDMNGRAVAVTTSGASNSWKPEYCELLKGKRVVILPDADEPGRAYAQTVGRSFELAGIEHEIVSFEDYGNDVRDFLAAGKTAQYLVEHIDSPWIGSALPKYVNP